MSGEQRWHPAYLPPRPLYAALLALAFERGIAASDLRLEEYLEGEHPLSELPERAVAATT